MQPSAQPSKASRWGSLLQQAVAGVESRLDTILAEPDSSPKKEVDSNSQQQQQQQQQRVQKDSLSAVPPSLKAENGKYFCSLHYFGKDRPWAIEMSTEGNALFF
jgi:hypothetical protein